MNRQAMPALLCHPLSLAPMVRSVEAGVSRTAEGHLVFSYRLCGDMARILIPATGMQSRDQALWEHTCFEAFLCAAGEPSAYREYNFSPSGQWASYAFSAYRQPDANADPLPPPRIASHKTDGRLELTARIDCDGLPALYAASALRIGLSAVIENTDTVDDNRSYWALRHPAGRPDFHQRTSFAFDLPVP